MASTSNLTPGKGLDNKDLEGTSVKGSAFFCYDLWKKVYEDLGEVTAFYRRIGHFNFGAILIKSISNPDSWYSLRI